MKNINYLLSVLSICVFHKFARAQQWQPVGIGMNSAVNTIAEYNGELYAAGHFTQADGQFASRIARWNGISWNYCGNFNDAINCLCVYNGELYAGGRFTIVDGVPASHIAKFNGSTWNTVGMGTNDNVHCFKVYQNKLYAGGAFRVMDTQIVNGISYWDGISWHPCLSGVAIPLPFSYSVNSLFEYGGKLFVGGVFNSAGLISMKNLAIWDGVIWSKPTPGSGFNSTVYTICTYNNKLYVGGEFNGLDGNSTAGIAYYDGLTWGNVAGGLDMRVLASSVYRGKLYVGGTVIVNGGQNLGYLATWNNVQWQQADTNITSEVRSIYTSNSGNNLYAGGLFTNVGHNGTGDNIASIYLDKPLPIELCSFTAVCQEGAPLISWTTSSETNNAYFVLERSSDAVNYTSLYTTSGAGTTSSTHWYQYLDNTNINLTSYYRLIQYDYDGQSTTSPSIGICCSSQVSMVIYNSDNQSIECRTNSAGILRVVSVLGQIVVQKTIPKDGESIPCEKLSPGIYFVSIDDGDIVGFNKFVK